jgi:hypothetical protein
MFKHSRWARAGGAVTALSLLTGLAMAGPAAAATGWTVTTIPQTANNTELNAMFARTGTDAWAVGVQFGAAGQAPPPPAAYHWNGSTWSLTPTPSLGVNGGLSAVSASGAADAWAVGFTIPSGYRRHVALYEHWNGSAWSVAAGPGGGLNGVADLSATNAWAVGALGAVEHWDGTAWTSVTVPSPNPSDTAGNNLTAITAISATDIWAVGQFTNASFTNSAYALHYNGTSWTVTILPQPAVTGPSSPVLHGVTAVASNNVWAVGENEEVPGLGLTTLIEHWNGSAWSIVPSPTPGAYPTLNAVAARSASDVYAVGFNEPSVNGGVQQGLILRWNGSAWSAGTDPTAGTFSPLYGAATLPGATAEWAAGINSADHALVLAHG